MGGHGFQRHQTQRKASSLTKLVITRQGTAKNSTSQSGPQWHRRHLTGSPAQRLNGLPERTGKSRPRAGSEWLRRIVCIRFTYGMGIGTFWWLFDYVFVLGFWVVVGVCLLIQWSKGGKNTRPGTVEIPAKCIDIPQITYYNSFAYFIGCFMCFCF